MKIFEALAQQFAGKPIDWDELEHALIRADLGVSLTTRILKKLQEREAWSLLGISDVIKVAREEIARIFPGEAKPIQPLSGKPNVVLIVCVLLPDSSFERKLIRTPTPLRATGHRVASHECPNARPLWRKQRTEAKGGSWPEALSPPRQEPA